MNEMQKLLEILRDVNEDVDFDGECHPRGREVGVAWGL